VATHRGASSGSAPTLRDRGVVGSSMLHNRTVGAQYRTARWYLKQIETAVPAPTSMVTKPTPKVRSPARRNGSPLLPQESARGGVHRTVLHCRDKNGSEDGVGWGGVGWGVCVWGGAHPGIRFTEANSPKL
jgi:hypothetical protein